MSLCNDCIDSGWQLHIIMPGGKQGLVDVNNENDIPVGSIKTLLPCHCDLGQSQISISEGIDKPKNK